MAGEGKDDDLIEIAGWAAQSNWPGTDASDVSSGQMRPTAGSAQVISCGRRTCLTTRSISSLTLNATYGTPCGCSVGGTRKDDPAKWPSVAMPVRWVANVRDSGCLE